MVHRMLLLFGWLLLLSSAFASEWSGFRGPNGSGIGEGAGLPVKLGPEENVVWKTGVPEGQSSPALSGDRIFLTAYSAEELITLSLDRATGRILWRRAIARPRTEKTHKLNSAASSTPATDGSNVYVFFGDFGLVSYGPDGNERWRLPLGPFSNLHGMAVSPVVLGDKLILVCDQDTDSYLMAVHKDTAKVLWKTERNAVVHGFATPTVFRPKNGPVQLIVPGSYLLVSYSADDGKELWWVRGLTWQVKPTAVVTGDTVFVTGWAPGADPGERRPLPPFEEVLQEADQDQDKRLTREEVPPKWKHSGSWEAIDLNRDGFLDSRDWSFYRARRSSQNVTMAVRPGSAKGDITDTHVLWSYDRSVPVVSSPLLYQGLLYTIKDGGVLTALDPETGAVRKQGRVTGAIDSYYASPVAADNKIYLVSETGKASVIRPGADWEPLAVNDLEEPCYASPAIADNRVYIRTRTALYAFGTK